jgi:hypothetical protein
MQRRLLVIGSSIAGLRTFMDEHGLEQGVGVVTVHATTPARNLQGFSGFDYVVVPGTPLNPDSELATFLAANGCHVDLRQTWLQRYEQWVLRKTQRFAGFFSRVNAFLLTSRRKPVIPWWDQ